MFLDNKYTKTYFRIIENRLANPVDGYVERHHIIPSSLGGSNDRTNKVPLTAKEHWVCHMLLPKMLEGQAKYRMMAAIGRMAVSNKNSFKHNSRSYQIAKRMLAEAASALGKGRPCSEQQKEKLRQKALNLDPEIRNKISDSTRAKSPAMREKLRVIALARDPAHYEKISLATKGKPRPISAPQPILRCEHCGLEAKKQTITRYHGSKCRHYSPFV